MRRTLARKRTYPAPLALLLCTAFAAPAALAQDNADPEELPTVMVLKAKVSEARPAGPVLLVLPASPEMDPMAAAGLAVTPQGTLAQIDRQGDELAVRWIAEEPLKAGTIELVLEPVDPKATPASFHFEDAPGRRHLLHGSRKVYTFEHAFEPARDRDGTYKPFHQVASLHDDGFVTKGVGGNFTHHRGLFVGWNKTREVGGDQSDFWHCRNGVSQRWREHLAQRTGPVCADSVERIDWCAADGSPVVHEVRSITAWHAASDRHVFDVAIELFPAGQQKIELRGDPQHAGFQFRAAQAVHDAQKDTVYVRPETANGGKNDVWKDLGWTMLQFDLRGQPYDVVHVSHPENPGPWVYSTRAYGRFGAFQEFDLEPGKSTVLRYRVVVAKREAGTDPAAAAAAFRTLAVEAQ